MKYGLPYQGSKSIIADFVVNVLPKRENLYDLFAGGCAITHCAMLKNKYKRYFVNDINDTPQLFIDAVNGRYKDENRWISREDFFKYKDIEPYIRICWSFGNNGQAYLYSREIEENKHALHEIVFNDDYTLLGGIVDDKCLSFIKEYMLKFSNSTRKKKRIEIGRAFVKYFRETKNIENPYYEMCHFKDNNVQSLESFESLERLQSLQSLERLQSFEYTNKSYDEVEIIPNSVIYCDIPYKNTNRYNNTDFNHEKFYDWCERQNELVVVSEYSMPEDRFTCVTMKNKMGTFSPTKTNKVIEKLFVPNCQLELFKRLSVFSIDDLMWATPKQGKLF